MWMNSQFRTKQCEAKSKHSLLILYLCDYVVHMYVWKMYNYVTSASTPPPPPTLFPPASPNVMLLWYFSCSPWPCLATFPSSVLFYSNCGLLFLALILYRLNDFGSVWDVLDTD
uniref:Uncharacterized protein n=1 Tax=Opuntia streptacantha TaxID=393608 RepID=A0A7C9DRV1_OPUST